MQTILNLLKEVEKDIQEECRKKELSKLIYDTEYNFAMKKITPMRDNGTKQLKLNEVKQ